MGILSKIASLWKRTGKRGQHTIEYAVLIILIMAGIIVMSRYVIRSWNANLKGWEDSAKDSFEDPLTETPPPPIAGCTAGNWTQQGCGLGRLDVCSGTIIQCAETEMTYLRSYTPAGCQCGVGGGATVNCLADPCCCTTPLPVACAFNMSSGTPPPACSNAGLSPTTASGCPNGFMGYSTQCGGSNYVGCKPDPSCLVYCPIQSLVCTTDGSNCSFPRTPAGSNGISSCPPGYLADPLGPPTAPCDSFGNWGSVVNLCYLPCGDGNCDSTIGENCFSCPADCGAPISYGGYTWCSSVCGDGICDALESCATCPADCPQTCIFIPLWGQFCFPCT